MDPGPPTNKSRDDLGALGLLAWSLWLAVILGVPLIAVWLASSLAAYLNGPRWLAFASGALLFPVLPVAWEIRASNALARRKQTARRWLSLQGRLAARTMAISLAFIGAIVALKPEHAFLSLATRGDWMLDGHHGRAAQISRGVLFGAAGSLAWLYTATRDDPFAAYRTHAEPPPPPSPAPVPPPRPVPEISSSEPPPAPAVADAGGTAATAGKADPADAGRGPEEEIEVVGFYEVDGEKRYLRQRRSRAPAVQPATKEATARQADRPAPPPRWSPASTAAPVWPQPAELAPAIGDLPSSAEESLDALADHLRRRTSDAAERVKLAHDYVADRVAYDVEAYRTRRYPPQDAQTVFASRRAVCAGYAKLFEELARRMELEVVTVVGIAKGASSGEPEPHGWNAVRLNGQWQLVDVTWDSGMLADGAFLKRYDTSYLLAPPEFFAISHLPDEPGWQLVPTPIDRAQFMRLPRLSPAFFAKRLEFVGEVRSQIDAYGSAELTLRNPAKIDLVAWMTAKDEPARQCATTDDAGLTRLRCDFPKAGSFGIAITEHVPGSKPQDPRGPIRYDGLASIDVINRG